MTSSVATQVTMPAVLSKDTEAEALRAHLQGKLEDDKLDAAVSALSAATASTPANGNVISAVFYLRFTIDCGTKEFVGDAGGLSTPGGGALIGDIYTADLNRLFSDTRSFSFVGTVGYCMLNFFDSHSTLLGTGHFGAVSIVSGAGGGTGRWSG
jgi:hypothetical protein